MAQKNEDQWEARFGGPVPDAEGNTIWPSYGASLEGVRASDPATVWSVIEGDETENLYLLPGFHVVNLVGYVIAEQPRTPEEDKSGEWDEVLWVDGEEIERNLRP